MQTALLASAALMGLAGMPHCTAMCSAPCAAALGRDASRGSVFGFHAARLLGYAAAGAAVASVVGGLAALSEWTPALRPVWTLLHAAALTLGVWLLLQGRQPQWLGRIGRVPAAAAVGGLAPPRVISLQPSLRTTPPVQAQSGWVSLGRAVGAGSAWVLWPCGLLQSALLVAALGADAGAGASVMAVFAVTSAPGLLLGPWLARRLFDGGRNGAARESLATRLAGALLVVASGWALGHGLWTRVAAFCGLG